MWAGDEQPFNGTHYQLDRPLNSPQALQRPHPPIMIGGGGEKKTLRLVAQYADACNLFGNMPAAELRRKLDILREHCAAVGRPYEAIEKTALIALKLTRDGANGTVTPAAAIEQLGALAELGFDHALLSLHNVTAPGIFDPLATDLIPQATAISVAGR